MGLQRDWGKAKNWDGGRQEKKCVDRNVRTVETFVRRVETWEESGGDENCVSLYATLWAEVEEVVSVMDVG
jgi:hypothetical protein